MSEVSDLAAILAISPEQAIVAGGTVASAWALKKVIGPSLDAIGNALGDFSGYRVRNLLCIGEKISTRLDETPLETDASIHPRIAKELLEEGTWAADDVSQEYFAGMMLSAANEDPEQGHAGYIARVIAGLSPSHLRLHHAIYSTMVGRGPVGDFGSTAGRNALAVEIPSGALAQVVELGWAGTLVAELEREGLLGKYSSSTEGTHQYPLDWAGPEAGLALTPSLLGAELFLAAYGLMSMHTTSILSRQDLPQTKTEMPTFESFKFRPLAE